MYYTCICLCGRYICPLCAYPAVLRFALYLGQLYCWPHCPIFYVLRTFIISLNALGSQNKKQKKLFPKYTYVMEYPIYILVLIALLSLLVTCTYSDREGESECERGREPSPLQEINICVPNSSNKTVQLKGKTQKQKLIKQIISLWVFLSFV